MGLSVLAAVGFAIGITKKKFKPAVIAPVAMLIVGAVGVGGALVVQNLVVTPDEINKESKYLERNIEYTQSAYGLNDVDMKGFEANQNLTSKDIANNADTISNIRINDYAPALREMLTQLRVDYGYNNTDALLVLKDILARVWKGQM